MTETDQLLHEVATTIGSYREGEIESPTPAHVERWLRQFTADSQLPLLREFSHVIRNTFLTKEWTSSFLERLSANQELCGANPAQFWANAHILQVQRVGGSQQEMVSQLSRVLNQRYGLDIARCGTAGGDYIYLDDAIFSGSRVIGDLSDWIRNQAPDGANLQIIVMALHRGGYYWTRDKLQAAAREAGKTINLKYWRAAELENRRTYKNNSNVLWPSSVPDSDEARTYIETLAASRFPLDLRTPGPQTWPFSSEAGRQVLESEFLIAGARIKARLVEEKHYFRPLGFGSFGAGFGSLIATYRNCPNNAPLALWWGDGGATNAALNWYPLLKRRTNMPLENIVDDLTR